MWMIARKATSTPLNANTLCFLVKREESRSFDVILGFFFFLVFGREKKMCREVGQRVENQKKCCLQFGACLGLFITSSANFEATGLRPLRPSKSVDMDTSRKILDS